MATGDKKSLINQRAPAAPACPRLKNGRAKQTPQKSPEKRPGQRPNLRPCPPAWRCWPAICTTAQPAPGSRRHGQRHQARRAACRGLSCAPAGAGEHGAAPKPAGRSAPAAPPWPPDRSTGPTLGAQHLAQPWGHKPKADGGTKPTRRGHKAPRYDTGAHLGAEVGGHLKSGRVQRQTDRLVKFLRAQVSRVGGVSQRP
jgi:hypothetical protein